MGILCQIRYGQNKLLLKKCSSCFITCIFCINLQESVVFTELKLVITFAVEEYHESLNLCELRVCFHTKRNKLTTSIANTHCLFDFTVDSTVAEKMKLVNIVVSSFIRLSSFFM